MPWNDMCCSKMSFSQSSSNVLQKQHNLKIDQNICVSIFSGHDETDRYQRYCGLSKKKRETEFTDDLDDEDEEIDYDTNYVAPVSIQSYLIYGPVIVTVVIVCLACDWVCSLMIPRI